MTTKCFLSIGGLLLILEFGLAGPSRAAENQILWQIGQKDGSDMEFALAPADSSRFQTDGVFFVGKSNPKTDWPYVQPGPDDAWAGNQPHIFTIYFALKNQSAKGECHLRLFLCDAQKWSPPKLQVFINGHEIDEAVPPGNGDASINGEFQKGRASEVDVVFAADWLLAGNNKIQIKTAQGSWMLYDAVRLAAPAGLELSPTELHPFIQAVEAFRALEQRGGKLFQPVDVTVRQVGDAADAKIQLGDAPPVSLHLNPGETKVELLSPATDREITRTLTLKNNQGETLASQTVTLKPVPKLTIYIVPHSHTDIGYTEAQALVAKKQVNNLVQGMALARQTATNPPDARFVWNVEVFWAADLYLHSLSPAQKAEFVEAVRRGEVGLNGAYLNELTGLCRPEELLRLFKTAAEFSRQTGVTIDSAMISDVPGYTWGTVTAMAQAGIKYFSAAPNYFDRIGTILRAWQDKPFYWVGPDGKSQVLIWIPFWGYALSHHYVKISPQLIDEFCDDLQQRNYPYDIAYIRWSGHGDNAAPDPDICGAVKNWNAKYAWPKLIISQTSAPFRALEQRYGKSIPRFRGDLTPYWEDGAGSSALETGLNRANADRLSQAETLFALLNPGAYPAEAFSNAWRNVLLYSEHTWGADCSVTQPESEKTREQWAVKKGYVTQADAASRELLRAAAQSDSADSPPSSAVDVFNTLSWPRTDLVTLSPQLSAAGDRVLAANGNPVPSQRLSSGELVFLASNVPAFAARRFTITAGAAFAPQSPVRVDGASLDNGLIHVRLNEKTGGISELTLKGVARNLVDTNENESVNDYLYLRGADVSKIQTSGPAHIRVGENGPLVASLIAESAAPGCHQLRREIRLVAGLDHVELIDRVDKARIPGTNYRDEASKESVNFAFPFNVPAGEMSLDVPWGVMDPQTDQLPGSCKNWFTVSRWLDVANDDCGVTWATLDAPLVEIGGITANLLNSQTNPDVWRKTVGRTQKFYSWAMNNHWGTNYRAYQEGLTTFRFFLRPHRHSTPAENTRFATAFSYPLLPVSARSGHPLTKPFLQVSSPDVITTLKPSEDGKALIVRLFNVSKKNASVNLLWADSNPKDIYLSDTAEAPLAKINGAISLPPMAVATLRIELEL